MRTPVAVAFAALSLIWGSTWMFIKIGVAYWPPLYLIGVRMLLAGVALLALLAAIRRPLPRRWRDWWPGLAFGVVNGAAMAVIASSQPYIPSALGAVLVATMPIFTLFLARWWVREAITPVKLAGVALGFAGVVLAVGARAGGGWAGTALQQSLGQAGMLVGALLYAASYTFGKRFFSFDILPLTAIHLTSAGVFVLAAAAVLNQAPTGAVLTGPALGSLLYLALVGSSLAYWLMFYLITHLTSVQAAYPTLINPVVAVLLGVAFMGEALAPRAILGTAAVLAGAWLVTRPAAPGR